MTLNALDPLLGARAVLLADTINDSSSAGLSVRMGRQKQKHNESQADGGETFHCCDDGDGIGVE